MKSKELTVELKMTAEDKTVILQSGTTETVEQTPIPLTIESARTFQHNSNIMNFPC